MYHLAQKLGTLYRVRQKYLPDNGKNVVRWKVRGISAATSTKLLTNELKRRFGKLDIKLVTFKNNWNFSYCNIEN